MTCQLVLESQTPDADGKYRFKCPVCDRRTRNRNPAANIKRTCNGKTPDHGPGTELTKMLHDDLGLDKEQCQACKDMARRMDRLGVDGCRAVRSELAAELQSRAAKKGWKTKLAAAATSLASGLALRLNPFDVYGSLIDEACRRAALKTQSA